MIDVNQFLSVSGIAIVVGVLMQVFKARLMPEIVPMFAVILGILLSLLLAWGTGQLTTATAVTSYSLSGLLGGAAAIGYYEATVDKLKPRAGPDPR